RIIANSDRGADEFSHVRLVIPSMTACAPRLDITASSPSPATACLLWAMVVDSVRGMLHMKPHYIPAVAGEGELAVMSSRGA
ncbi:hypothetical protein C6A85_10340, partial [Mycobacterium sp. ITM-2017-0098]